MCYQVSGSFRESSFVLGCPPVAHYAITVKITALVIKAMADLMPNYSANASIILQRHLHYIKKGRLQDGSWKYNFV